MKNSGQSGNSKTDAAIERLIDQYSSNILKMCYVYLKDIALAEDAMQETFIKAYRSLATYRGTEDRSEKSWLMRIAINTCKDFLRSGWFRHVDRSTQLGNVQEPTWQPDNDGMLVEAIAQLPRKEKEVILLYYYQDMKVEEIATAIGVSSPTIYARLKKAKARLSTTLGRWCEV